jgi:hypothetical protein
LTWNGGFRSSVVIAVVVTTEHLCGIQGLKNKYILAHGAAKKLSMLITSGLRNTAKVAGMSGLAPPVASLKLWRVFLAWNAVDLDVTSIDDLLEKLGTSFEAILAA